MIGRALKCGEIRARFIKALKGERKRILDNELNLHSIEKSFKSEKLKADIRFFDEIGSTNDVAKEIYEEEGVFALVVAASQTKGRGRNGRNFLSDKGGAFFSLTLKLDGSETPPEMFEFILLSALAVSETVKSYGITCRIKWPNDVLAGNGKKICGILTQTGYKNNKPDYIIIGTGVNVNQTDFGIYNDIAVSMKQITHTDYNIADIIAGIVRNFFTFACLKRNEIVEIYKKRCVTLGKSVQVVSSRENYFAFAQDLSASGSLIVKTQDGKLHEVLYGDVSIREVQS